jgi:uncharacterized protein (DUF1501 family)
MQRRDFLNALALGAGLVVPLGRGAWAATGTAPTQKKLVVVMLRGAVDGLNVVAPVGDANYARLRPTIGLGAPGTPGGALALDGYFGLHPALASLQPLWDARRLAFVHASGSPDATRSHFDAQDYMESATPGRKATPDGWMNRLEPAAGHRPGPAAHPVRPCRRRQPAERRRRHPRRRAGPPGSEGRVRRAVRGRSALRACLRGRP